VDLAAFSGLDGDAFAPFFAFGFLGAAFGVSGGGGFTVTGFAATGFAATGFATTGFIGTGLTGAAVFFGGEAGFFGLAVTACRSSRSWLRSI
jgi:hypothetical protein